MTRLESLWYSRIPIWLVLWPLSLLFFLISTIRRGLFKSGIKSSFHPGIPVIVVGNISVGGSGKTPLVTWLCDELKAQGYRPGIISRGYGGEASEWPQLVNSDSDPKQVGDETVLLARRTGCPLVAAPDRVAAAELLRQQSDVDLIICDDGLQHYRLQRDIEISVIDGQRRLGNGWLLPSGPLRERASRQRQVDWVVTNGNAQDGEIPMSLAAESLIHLESGKSEPISDWQGRECHAVAGIGNPKRFFEMLRLYQLNPIEHPFADHHPYTKSELEYTDELPIVMTEKDAVKCGGFANQRIWYIPVSAQLPEEWAQQITQSIESRSG